MWEIVDIMYRSGIDFRCDEWCADSCCQLQQDACSGACCFHLFIYCAFYCCHYMHRLRFTLTSKEVELIHFCLCYCKCRHLTREHFTLEHHRLHLTWHCHRLHKLVLRLVVDMEDHTCQWFHISRTLLRFCIILCHRSVFILIMTSQPDPQLPKTLKLVEYWQRYWQLRYRTPYFTGRHPAPTPTSQSSV